MGSLTEKEIIDLIDEIKDNFVKGTLKGNTYDEISSFGIEMFADTLKSVIPYRIYIKEEQYGH